MSETVTQVVVHVRFDGRSLDVPLNELDIASGSSDAAVKQAVAVHLDVPASRLRDHVVDRHKTGNLTVRPPAVFG